MKIVLSRYTVPIVYKTRAQKANLVKQAKTVFVSITVGYGNNESGTGKESWGRQLHLLNYLTSGQVMATQGDQLQNPFYIAQGCEIMFEVLGPMIKEKGPMETEDGTTALNPHGKPQNKTLKGIETPTYKRYRATLSEIRFLINASMQQGITNKAEILGEAYRLSINLKAELIQKASDFELDFKAKKDYMEAYRDEE